MPISRPGVKLRLSRGIIGACLGMVLRMKKGLLT